MSDMRLFNFQDHKVRIVYIDGEPQGAGMKRTVGTETPNMDDKTNKAWRIQDGKIVWLREPAGEDVHDAQEELEALADGED